MSYAIDETHDVALTSWVDGANGHSDFPVQNLPLGIFSPSIDAARRIGVAIGDKILDLSAIAPLLPRPVQPTLLETSLNQIFALPAAERTALRRRLSQLLTDDAHRALVEEALHPSARCSMHLPAVVGDYTDFYVGIYHATNIGKLFRPDNPLLPNYKHVPIGYHGRASSVRPSGIPVRRPSGQSKAPDAESPTFGPSRRLDYELELGIWIGSGNSLGQPIPIAQAQDHVAGFCLLNDWSARDFQAWEYVPLGPFLAKNFQTTVSAWVVTADALAPYRIAQPARAKGDPQPLPYLWDANDQAHGALNIHLSAAIQSAAMRDRGLAPFRLCEGSASSMYWTVAQIVAHHTSNGCNLNPGDLLGTGTISGPSLSSVGSMLELTQGGTTPITLPTGETRTFLEDGDELLLSAWAEAEGRARIGFGACRAIVESGCH